VEDFGMNVGVQTSKGGFDLGYKESNGKLKEAL
jgi:hypothetical protein